MDQLIYKQISKDFKWDTFRIKLQKTLIQIKYFNYSLKLFYLFLKAQSYKININENIDYLKKIYIQQLFFLSKTYK